MLVLGNGSMILQTSGLTNHGSLSNHHLQNMKYFLSSIDSSIFISSKALLNENLFIILIY